MFGEAVRLPHSSTLLLGDNMFFTDHSFTGEEKIETADKAYLMERRKIKQMGQESQSHPEELERQKQPREQYHQQYF